MATSRSAGRREGRPGMREACAGARGEDDRWRERPIATGVFGRALALLSIIVKIASALEDMRTMVQPPPTGPNRLSAKAGQQAAAAMV